MSRRGGGKILRRRDSWHVDFEENEERAETACVVTNDMPPMGETR